MRGVLDTTLCDQVCQYLAAGLWFSPGTPISSKKTDRPDLAEILLKLALNTITITLIHICISIFRNNVQIFGCKIVQHKPTKMEGGIILFRWDKRTYTTDGTCHVTVKWHEHIVSILQSMFSAFLRSKESQYGGILTWLLQYYSYIGIIVSVVGSCYTGYFVVLSCIRRRVYLI